MKKAIELVSLGKTYESQNGSFEALKSISLSIEKGEVFGIMGLSGAGKSTLIRCINLLECPSSGTVFVGGIDMRTLSKKELREKRRSIGMIFQGFNLLMQKTALENVCLPLYLAKMPKKQALQRGNELLKMVGLPDKSSSYPAQLSGGQQQRVAIARALALNPEILLCDEATSALDNLTSAEILDLLRDLGKRLNVTVVLITHQLSVAKRICDRVAVIDGGELAECGETTSTLKTPQSDAARRLIFGERTERLEIEEIGKEKIYA